MADRTLEFKVEFDSAEATRDARSFSGALEDTSGSATSFSGALKAAGAAFAAYQVIKQATQFTIAFANELEATSGVLNRLQTDITEAANRTNGLISQMDLMAAANKASRGDLGLTAKEFANLSVAASEFAAATGGDAKSALDQLTQAMVGRSMETLQQYGIQIEEGTKRSQVLGAALGQLEQKFGDAESSADTAGGAIGVMSNRLDDAKTDFFKAINASSDFERAMSDMGKLVGQVADAFGLSFGSMREAIAGTVAFISIGIQTMVDNLKQLLNATALISTQIEQGNFGQAVRTLEGAAGFLAASQATFLTRVQASAQASLADLNAPFTPAGSSGGGGRRRGGAERSGPAPANDNGMEAELAEQEKARLARLGASSDAAKEQARKDAEAQAEVDKARLTGIGANETANQIQKATESASSAFRDSWTGSISDVVDAFDVYNTKMKELGQTQMTTSELMSAVVQKTGGDIEDMVGGAMTDAVRTNVSAWVEGEKSIGQALEGILSQTLSSIAQESAVQAIFETAKGLATLFTNPVESGTHFAAAAMYGAVAATAGVASAAVGGGSSSKSGGSASGPSSFQGSASSDSSREPTTVIVNLTGIHSEADTGRVIADALGAARKQYGNAVLAKNGVQAA